MQAVLKAEYPRGVDVVYEGVGGDMFSTALDALAPRGRLIIIGMIGERCGLRPAPHAPMGGRARELACAALAEALHHAIMAGRATLGGAQGTGQRQ